MNKIITYDIKKRMQIYVVKFKNVILFYFFINQHKQSCVKSKANLTTACNYLFPLIVN